MDWRGQLIAVYSFPTTATNQYWFRVFQFPAKVKLTIARWRSYIDMNALQVRQNVAASPTADLRKVQSTNDNKRMWPESDKTQELLEGARDGKESAVNDLMERHRDSLRQLVRMRMDKKLQQRVDISDIVQDTLIEASRRLSTYLQDPKLNFHIWLRHIARDRIIDAHRRHRVSAKRSIDREQRMSVPAGYDHSSIQLAAQLSDNALTPAARATQRELAVRVEEAISQLDERDSEIIVMRHYEQLSNQETAQALELTEPAASMRYLRAVRRLKGLLTGESSAEI